jgi:hypothetical protein
MTRHPKRRDQHQIESKVEVSQVRAGNEEGLGSSRDPSSLPRRQSCSGDVDFAARLHFDHREHTAAPRQNVDLA